MSTATEKRWVSGAHARRISGLSWNALLRLGASGQVRTLALPGALMKFDAEDVERVAKELNAELSK